MATSGFGRTGDVIWGSAKQRTYLEASWLEDPVSLSGYVTAICRIPALDYRFGADTSLREGFLIFHTGGANHLSTERGACIRPLPTECSTSTIRAAVCVRPPESGMGEVVALIAGGDAPPQTREGDAEPPPWVTATEVRLAWLQGERLIIGSPEPLSGVNPWRLRVGKFAGEHDNLLVCTYNEAPFDSTTRRRPWIYRVVEGDDGLPYLDPRWRGTSFAHPFRDATFGDFTGANEGEIAALEVTESGGRMLTAYRFKGFGLEGLAPSVRLPAVGDRLEAANWLGDRADELVVRAHDGRFIFYQLAPESGSIREALSVSGPPAVLGWTITSASATASGELTCLLPDGEVWRASSPERRD